MEPPQSPISSQQVLPQFSSPSSSSSSSSMLTPAAAIAKCIRMAESHGVDPRRPFSKTVDNFILSDKMLNGGADSTRLEKIKRDIEKYEEIRSRLPKRTKIEEIKPRFYKEDLDKAHDKQTKTNVAIALDHYNATTKGPKYQLLQSFGSNSFMMCGLYIHVCFLAKPIADVDNAADTSPKHFFAEVVYPFGVDKDTAVSCCIVDPDRYDTRDGCGACPPGHNMYHPYGGFEAGKYPYKASSFPMPPHYYDKDVPEERKMRMSYS